MNKNIWTIVAPDEAIPFRVIKPFYGSLHLCAPPEWRPGCFSWRQNWDKNPPPRAIICAECTRMRHSVKRAFFSSVSKKERFCEHKNDSAGGMRVLDRGIRVPGLRNSKRIQGLFQACSQTEIFVSRGYL
jgi:hypothetical protein